MIYDSVKEAYARAKSAKSPTNPQALFIEERSCVWSYVDLRLRSLHLRGNDDLVLGELEAEEGTRMDISVSVPQSDTCSTPEKGQGNYSLFLPPARDSTVIPIGKPHPLVGTSSISAAHENQKEPHLSVETSFISTAHENQKEPHPTVGISSISVPYNDTCSTVEKGIGNKSLDLLPAHDRSPIPIGGVHSTQEDEDMGVGV
ncbi:predicted protein [Arabidopsis lyrata subsp. lyrata]|uniref:Predicted protein n=1 Tax=Arabidopsis lyrata subsp. lyrata TaxID=81972 RepID=D7KAW5_ARALL|nr:predicted protein [Arabidopsis lyrata subsp. lyrata]